MGSKANAGHVGLVIAMPVGKCITPIVGVVSCVFNNGISHVAPRIPANACQLDDSVSVLIAGSSYELLSAMFALLGSAAALCASLLSMRQLLAREQLAG
jgi:hypothetical protein